MDSCTGTTRSRGQLTSPVLLCSTLVVNYSNLANHSESLPAASKSGFGSKPSFPTASCRH
eukprot:1406722-Amphidinium_carterae.1